MVDCWLSTRKVCHAHRYASFLSVDHPWPLSFPLVNSLLEDVSVCGFFLCPFIWLLWADGPRLQVSLWSGTKSLSSCLGKWESNEAAFQHVMFYNKLRVAHGRLINGCLVSTDVLADAEEPLPPSRWLSYLKGFFLHVTLRFVKFLLLPISFFFYACCWMKALSPKREVHRCWCGRSSYNTALFSSNAVTTFQSEETPSELTIGLLYLYNIEIVPNLWRSWTRIIKGIKIPPGVQTLVVVKKEAGWRCPGGGGTNPVRGEMTSDNTGENPVLSKVWLV